MRYRRIVVCVLVVLGVGLGSAWAQIAVTDPSTTARNAVVAVLKHQIVDVVRMQHERLRNMARRLSAQTNLDKYASPEAPQWGTYGDANPLTFGDSYRAALVSGDPNGSAYTHVARTRQHATDALAGLTPGARDMVERALATLDAADSAIIAGTHQTGILRANGRRELSAIDALESDVIDPL